MQHVSLLQNDTLSGNIGVIPYGGLIQVEDTRSRIICHVQ